MINLNWNSFIRDQQNTRDLAFVYFNPREDFNFVIKKADKVPFLACFTRKSVLEFEAVYRQFHRMVDLGTLMNVFLNGQNIVRVHVRRRYFLCGKGIILDNERNVLAMLTVTNRFYDEFNRENELTDAVIKDNFTLLVSRRLITDHNLKFILKAVNLIVDAHGIDVIYSSNTKSSFINTSLPVFRSLPEKREFLTGLLSDFLENRLMEEVMHWDQS